MLGCRAHEIFHNKFVTMHQHENFEKSNCGLRKNNGAGNRIPSAMGKLEFILNNKIISPVNTGAKVDSTS